MNRASHTLRARKMHLAFGVAGAVSGGLGYLFYEFGGTDAVRRGHTFEGYVLSGVTTLLILAVSLYSWRKRAGQERTAGTLSLWLSTHVWLAVLAGWLAVVHAGFHLDGGPGTWALAALGAAIVSGAVGYAIYSLVPPRVAATTGNLATADAVRAIEQVTRDLETSTAGRSEAFKERVSTALAGKSGDEAAAPVGVDEAVLWQAAQRLIAKRAELFAKLERQRSLHRQLRLWLFVHVPSSCVFLLALVAHAVDATDARWLASPPGPTDFQSPDSCATCHQAQYDEWIASMHAVAMSSPVTELQNRLVLLKEEESADPPLVGDLCVRCHAPTSRLGTPGAREDPKAPISARAPAGAFGVSCVACHLVTHVEAGRAPSDDPDLRFKNAENFRRAQGVKTMFGPLGVAGSPAVGNAAHRSAGSEFFTQDADSPHQATLCASCHTVVVEPPPPAKRVTLQDTYREWLRGNEQTGFNWKEAGLGCMDCHGRDLEPAVDLAAEMAARRTPLADRFGPMARSLLAIELPASDRLAAFPVNAFDAPLQPRRVRRHTFTGVDYHLEPSLPFVSSAPDGEAARIQQTAVELTTRLHKVAAAVLIRDRDSGGHLRVDVMNLGTGHDLPAGFAFAREMWLEVAVGDQRPVFPDGFRVVIGGNPDGTPLSASRALEKSQPGLRNFQAVLFGGSFAKEVVLQNEAVGVLKGRAAVAQGFPDRVQPLQPGEIRTLSVPLKDVGDGRVRVRLLFRNLPPEFLEGLARKFDLRSGEGENAVRARRLINALRIFEMARDERRVP